MKNQKTQNEKGSTKSKSFRLVRGFFFAFLMVTFLSGVVVLASKSGRDILPFAKPSVKVALSGNVVRDGERLDVSKEAVNPGDVLEWSIASENEGDASANEYSAIGQIPNGTEFVAGSAVAKEDANVTYSIDGGKSYSGKPMMKVKQADGSEKLVPAPASKYTQVRFEYSDSIAPAGKVSANYKVRVK